MYDGTIRHDFPDNQNQYESYHQRKRLSHQVYSAAVAHDAGVGVEHSHADYEERQRQNPRAKDSPEITCYGFASLDEIRRQHTCNYDDDAVDGQYAPVGQGALRKIPRS